MRTVALEEHFNLPDLSRRIDPAVLRQTGKGNLHDRSPNLLLITSNPSHPHARKS